MQRNHLFLPFIALFLGSAMLIGCQKNIGTPAVSEETETTLQASEDDAFANSIFNDIGDQAGGSDDDAGLGLIDLLGPNPPGNEGGEVLDDPHCFTIKIVPMQPGVFPKTITIDYGAGCKGRDGKIRKGKIITEFNKPLIAPGSQATTVFDGYYVDGVKVEGKHIIKNNSTSSVLILTRIVQNGKITFPNGNFIHWSAEHTRTQVAGLGTPGFILDDEWNTTGGAKGESKRGDKAVAWAHKIITPLHKAVKCRWIDKGTVKIERNGKTAVIDYGDGKCDNKATITSDGVEKEIKL